MRQLARHYAYLLPGFLIGAVSFAVLLVMTAVSLATSVIWIGILLLPMALLTASAFAELDRKRLRAWGAQITPPSYHSAGHGLIGQLRIIADVRRWLDLVFELFLALPLRLISFSLAMVWSAVAGAGLSYPLWGWSLPTDDGGGPVQLLKLTAPALVPGSSAARYLLDMGVFVLLGVVAALLLPRAISALATLDAMLSKALLGSGSGGELFSGRAWAWTSTCFTAVVLLAVAWPITAAVYSVHVALAMVLVLAHCAAIMLTLRWVWPGLGLSIMASAGLMTATADTQISLWPWLVTALITQCAVLGVAALTKPWYCAASGWCASALLTLFALLEIKPGLPEGALANSIVFASVSAGVVVGGSFARMWTLNVGRLEAAERTSAVQDRRRRELEERNRIAREMHDVVAHSMSVVSVQAATARYRLPEMDTAVQREFEEIAASCREALGEMRMLLSVLRAEDDAPTAPEPGLAEIDALIESTRASGTTIRYQGLGPHTPEVAPATGLAAYRTIQEALSNALRHAPGTTIDVRLTVEENSRIQIVVLNGAPASQAGDASPGAGLGLVGLRERVGAVGGIADVGATPEGGFFVRATLPL